jgi:hypothetical protein
LIRKTGPEGRVCFEGSLTEQAESFDSGNLALALPSYAPSKHRFGLVAELETHLRLLT